jgi:WD40 repeat protein
MRNLIFLIFALVSITAAAQEARLVLPIGFTDHISNVIFSHDSKYFVVRSESSLKLFETNTAREIKEISVNASSVIFSKDDKFLLYSSNTGVKLVEIRNGKEKFVFTNRESMLTFANFEPDSENIIVFLERDSSCVFDKERGIKLSSFIIPFDGYNEPIVDEKSKNILSAKKDSIFLYDYVEKKIRIKQKSHSQSITKISFSKDSEYFVSSSLDSTIHVHSTKNGKLFSILSGHNNKINAFDISNDDKYISTASSDSTVNVYDFKTGQIIDKINSTLEKSISIPAKYLS